MVKASHAIVTRCTVRGLGQPLDHTCWTLTVLVEAGLLVDESLVVGIEIVAKDVVLRHRGRGLRNCTLLKRGYGEVFVRVVHHDGATVSH